MKHPKTFIEKAPQVRAILLGDENVQIVMRWIGQHSATPLYQRMNDTFIIDLLEGDLIIEIGWWVLRHADGTFSACTQEFMDENYEEYV